MNHLTHMSDVQLSAHLDGVLPERERAASDAHLSSCDACRARLAELAALDASLGRALRHDPGDAYFADFADRVAARIATESPSGASAPVGGKQPRSGWSWLLTPRGLSFAGGTAALLLVAGLAWMRFQGKNEGAGSLLDGSRPVVGSTARGPVTPPAAQPPAPAATDERAVAPMASDQAAPPTATLPAPQAGTSRAREVRTTPQGQEQTVRDLTPRGIDTPSRLEQREQSKVAKLPIAEMKRRTLVSAQEKAETRDLAASSRAETGAPAPAPAVSSLRAPAASEPQANAMRGVEDAAELAACGTVHDTRGQPIVAAQVVALGTDARNARTGSDGRFCLPSLRVGDTLSVLRVGYDPVRIVVGPGTSLAIRLEPVGTLSPERGSLALGKAQDSFKQSLEAVRAKAGFMEGSRLAPVADVYANQTPPIRLAVVDAREATARARRERTAGSYERAADRWERIGGLTVGQASWDSRFQGLAALREAYRLQPTSARATRLKARLNAFLAIVPETLPERTTALRWQAEIESSAR